MIKYLRINAIDIDKIGIRDLLIDINTGKIISGFIDILDQYKIISTMSIEEYAKNHNSIKANVMDNGVYELLDENNEVISSIQGYVPEWIEARYNCNEEFGDYIDYEISKDCFINAHDDIMNANELFHLIIAEVTSDNNNYSKETVLKNLGKLNTIKEKLKDPYYAEKLEQGIEVLNKKLKQWED